MLQAQGGDPETMQAGAGFSSESPEASAEQRQELSARSNDVPVSGAIVSESGPDGDRNSGLRGDRLRKFVERDRIRIASRQRCRQGSGCAGDKLVDLRIRPHGGRQILFLFSSLFDRMTEVTRLFPTEGLLDGLGERSGLGRLGDHGSPCHTLKESPVSAGDGKHRKAEQDLAGPPKHKPQRLEYCDLRQSFVVWEDWIALRRASSFRPTRDSKG